MSFQPNHISLYELTVHAGTPLSKALARGECHLPEEELSADMYDLAIETMKEAGLHRYEVSNFAVPGHESAHNMGYWDCSDSVGVGPGAHSCYINQGEEVADHCDFIQVP